MRLDVYQSTERYMIVYTYLTVYVISVVQSVYIKLKGIEFVIRKSRENQLLTNDTKPGNIIEPWSCTSR